MLSEQAFRRAGAYWLGGEAGGGYGGSVSGMKRDWVEAPALKILGGHKQISRQVFMSAVCCVTQVAGLTTPQRDLFGFPQVGSQCTALDPGGVTIPDGIALTPPGLRLHQVGSAYWTPDTIEAVSHHYGGAVSGWNGAEVKHPRSPMSSAISSHCRAILKRMEDTSGSWWLFRASQPGRWRWATTLPGCRPRLRAPSPSVATRRSGARRRRAGRRCRRRTVGGTIWRCARPY